jgi:hypothetical protein
MALPPPTSAENENTPLAPKRSASAAENKMFAVLDWAYAAHLL